MINFAAFKFHSVIKLPAEYEVYDFTQTYNPERTLKSPYGVGRYNEKRASNMYSQDIFSNKRDIHMGIDIGCPADTPVYSFCDGEIYLTGNNAQPGDYGYTIITKHILQDVALYALYGHLSAKSVTGKAPGMRIKGGEVLAWVGEKHENGGWNPHLHFQLSYIRPEVCDMPGVVSDEDHAEALSRYPDPRLVLGPLY